MTPRDVTQAEAATLRHATFGPYRLSFTHAGRSSVRRGTTLLVTLGQLRTHVMGRWLWRRGAMFVVTILSVDACGLDGAPSYSIAGAFFPAWLLCCTLGLIAALAFRVLLITIRLDDVMPVKLLVYTAFGSGLAVWSWLSLFGRA